MNESKRIGLIDQFITSVIKWKQYPALTKQKTGRVAAYLLVLVLLTTTISAVIPSIGYAISVGGFKNFILNGLPQFELKDGALSMEQRIEIDLGIAKYIVDTEKETFTKQDIDQDAYQEILISSKNIYLYEAGRLMQAPLSVFGNLYMDNEKLSNYTPMFYLIQVLSIVISYLGSLIMYLFSALLYSLFGLFMGVTKSVQMNFGTIFKVAIYAKSLSVIVGAVNQVMGYPISDYIWTSVAMFITFFYVTFGVAAHRIPPKGEGHMNSGF